MFGLVASGLTMVLIKYVIIKNAGCLFANFRLKQGYRRKQSNNHKSSY